MQVRSVPNTLPALTFFLGVSALGQTEALAQTPMDPTRAETYFKEAVALCEKDAGFLWGIPVCAPMVIADPPSQTIATSQRAPEGNRPRALGYANAAIDWGGQRWAIYIWDTIPVDDPVARGRMMLHEVFHAIQPKLKLITESTQNEHLDGADGRYWLRLEWRALSSALQHAGAEQKLAVADALAFRTARRAIAGAKENERREEIREGLAQYTGTVLAAPSAQEARTNVVEQLAAAEMQESYVQSFAYSSGAAYGVLLDVLAPGWTHQITAEDDLGDLLAAKSGIEPTLNFTAAAEKYDGPELRRAESQRDRDRQARISQLRMRFVDGPILILPLSGGGTLDIRGAAPISGVGTVFFGAYSMRGEWGTLEASDGVLHTIDGTSRILAGPVTVDGNNLRGPGWIARVSPEWILQVGPRANDLQVVRSATR